MRASAASYAAVVARISYSTILGIFALFLNMEKPVAFYLHLAWISLAVLTVAWLFCPRAALKPSDDGVTRTSSSGVSGG